VSVTESVTLHCLRLFLVPARLALTRLLAKGDAVNANRTQDVFDAYVNDLIHHKARQVAQQSGFNKSDVEDIEQDLRLELLDRCASFDASRASFHTFAARVVDGKIAKLIRHRNAAPRDPRREQCSLQDEIVDGDGRVVNRSETISPADDYRRPSAEMPEHERVGLRCDLESLMASQTPRQRRLCQLLRTMRLADAARILRVPRTTLHDDILKIRQRFEAAGLREYLVARPSF